jgi:hypothetical protein
MQLLSVTGPTVLARSGTLTLLFQCALRRTSADFSPLHFNSQLNSTLNYRRTARKNIVRFVMHFVHFEYFVVTPSAP